MVEVPVQFNKFIRTGIVYNIIKQDIGFVRFSFYSSKSKLIINFSYSQFRFYLLVCCNLSNTNSISVTYLRATWPKLEKNKNKKINSKFQGMELYDSKIKKVNFLVRLIFQKGTYISRNETFYSQAYKTLIFFLKTIFLIFQGGICKS